MQSTSTTDHQNIEIFTQPDHLLSGSLYIPTDAEGVIVFAHGSGSSRHSPRNKHVATVLNQAGFATLLLDLLTPEEEELDTRTHQYRFDMTLLANRLAEVIDWLTRQTDTRPLNIGLFGASTGAGAALVAAAGRSSLVSAVVSRGGRPDLAGVALPVVKAPTLLIVGGMDTTVIGLNRVAMVQMGCPVQLEVVSGATHLFEEDGTLDQVAQLASAWFSQHMTETES